MKTGYLYVLVHPTDLNLYKIGVTTRDPMKRLAEHNSHHQKHAGRLVKETGKKWEIKTYIEVADPVWAESVFWGSTPLADIPFLGGVEVQKMEWEWVKNGLDAAKKAGLRPSPKELPDHVYAYTVWMKRRLEGRDITLLGYIRSKIGNAQATFRCSNSHQWKTQVVSVAEGKGCTICGVGEKDPEEMRKIIKPSYLCWLIHPDKPGFIKIVLVSNLLNQRKDGWLIHRYRDVEEDPILAESLIWELLGASKPNHNSPLKIDERIVEQAFRDLIYRLRHEIALIEKEYEKRFLLKPISASEETLA